MDFDPKSLVHRTKISGVLAALVTFGAWISIYISVHGSGPGIEAAPHEALGREMARQALALLRPPGQITVIARDTSDFENPASELQFAAFKQAILKAHATIRSVRRLQVDPLRPVAVPSGDFFEFIRAGAEGDVIVSFMGPPLLTEAQRGQLGAVKPAIAAFCSGRLPELVDLKLLFEQGLLQAAIVARVHTGRETFSGDGLGRDYVAITRSNLSDLPALDDGPPH